jgi:hypothetical protein
MPGRLVFSTTADGAATPTEQLRITSDRYIRLASGTGGIQFGGDTAAVNALDDYEEGTFTPTIIGTTTAGTGTYSNQIGRYTKIGRGVFFIVNIQWTAHTGTGSMKIGGLPFTSSADNNPTPSISSNNLTLPADSILRALVAFSGTEITLLSSPTGGGANGSVAMDTSAIIYLTGHYEV